MQQMKHFQFKSTVAFQPLKGFLSFCILCVDRSWVRILLNFYNQVFFKKCVHQVFPTFPPSECPNCFLRNCSFWSDLHFVLTFQWKKSSFQTISKAAKPTFVCCSIFVLFELLPLFGFWMKLSFKTAFNDYLFNFSVERVFIFFLSFS
jgi:hypothetical protein